MFEFAAQAASGYGPNIVGALIAGVLTGAVAAGVAWWTATHEVGQAEARRAQDQRDREEREKLERIEREARDAERRKDEIRKAVLGQFLEAASEFNRLVTGTARGQEQLAAYRFLASRALLVGVLLSDEGTEEDLQRWFADNWAKLRKRFLDIRQTKPTSSRGSFSPAEIGEVRDLALKLEHALTRWSLQPVSKWSVEDLPEVFRFRYLSSEEAGEEGR